VQRRVFALLAALVLVRVTLPLVVLASSGSKLPGLPKYVYEPRLGDAYGFYSAMRELLATIPRLGVAAPVVVLAVAGLVAVVVRWRRRPRERPWLALLGSACVSAIATLLVLRMRAPGAATIGWPLVWSVPVLPYRVLGLPLNPDIAYGFGLTLSLAANAVTVVSTYLLGLWASGRRSVGLIAASLFGLWPLLMLVVGKTADLGTWEVDLGLALYSEPLSTALVASAAALLVRPGRGEVAEILAGALLGFSVAVRLSNVVIAFCVVAVLYLSRGRWSALRVSAGAATFVPLVAAYWPLGYPKVPEEQFQDPLGLDYALPAWRDSVVWGWQAFVALVPLAVVGTFALARRHAAFLWSWILLTAALYSFYFVTPLHPRFLLVTLPALFVLWAAGVVALANHVRTARVAHTEPT
jgi:hypothetical protein